MGGPGWYLDRVGFWHGACAPAVCWAGAAAGLLDAAEALVDDDPHRRAHLGALRSYAWSMRALLSAAGDEIDEWPDDVDRARARAHAVRYTIERIATEMLDRFGRAFGPRPFTRDAAVSQRWSDTHLYLRQHHGERDTGRGRARAMADVTGDAMMPEDYFRGLYDGSPDPWGFDERWYERRKFAVTMASLPRRRYRRALEPGCSNGALTEQSRRRCDELVAFDFVDDAVARCRDRMAAHRGVEVLVASFPEFWPAGTGDLVVWSEVAYYVRGEAADAALTGLAAWLEPGGHLVAVHYGGATNYPRQGLEIGPWLDDADFLERRCEHLDDGFELGVWERRPI